MVPASTQESAIEIRGVTKRFKKSTIRREYTTIKSELVSWLRGKKSNDSMQWIEALRGVDLTIPRGATVGILGRNGSGKSTLLKMITGIYAPTDGKITVQGRVSALLDLGAGFHPDFSGRENILINGIILGMSRAQVRARMDDIIAFSELGDFIDEPVRTYSSGMYMRLAFSVATHVDPDILIIDEILAVGDEHFGKKSLGRMTEFKQSGKTIVLVTHDLSTVERWCDLGVWIDGGRIRQVGPPREVVAQYRAAVALAEAAHHVFTPPALASDGGALPAVLAPAPSQLANAGPALPHVERVELINRAGTSAAQFDTEEPVTVRIGFSSAPDAAAADLGIQLLGANGQLVYRTDTSVSGVQLPSPLPLAGTLRLDIGRLGLLPGSYVLEAFSQARGTQTPVGVRACSFNVVSASGDAGVFRPPQRWHLERAELESAQPERIRIPAS